MGGPVRDDVHLLKPPGGRDHNVSIDLHEVHPVRINADVVIPRRGANPGPTRIGDVAEERGGWQALVAYLQGRARSGVTRVRGALVPNTQSAVAATIAWLLCRYLVGQPFPIFGAVACYLAMGFSRNRQPRRVLEIGLGATFGVFFGEMVVRYLGFGWWQVLLIMLLVPLWARFIDRADLMTFQSTINALVVVSMAALTSMGGIVQTGIGRWVDALIGAGVALVAAIVLPTSLTTRPRRYASTAILRLADACAAIGDGLEKGDGAHIRAAHGHLRAARNQLTDGRAAQSSAADLAMINPRLRSERAELAEIDRLLEISGRMHTSMTMLIRQGRAVVGESGPMPRPGALVKQVAVAMRHLSAAVGHWNKPVLAREEAAQIATELVPLEIAAHDDWRTTALVSLLRAVVVDLLQLTGLSMDQSRAWLGAIGDSPERRKARFPGEEGSSLWGTTTFPAVEADRSTGDAGEGRSVRGEQRPET